MKFIYTIRDVNQELKMEKKCSFESDQELTVSQIERKFEQITDSFPKYKLEYEELNTESRIAKYIKIEKTDQWIDVVWVKDGQDRQGRIKLSELEEWKVWAQKHTEMFSVSQFHV